MIRRRSGLISLRYHHNEIANEVTADPDLLPVNGPRAGHEVTYENIFLILGCFALILRIESALQRYSRLS